jgi:hypothetical protein
MILEHDLDSLIGAAEQRLIIALGEQERLTVKEALDHACQHAGDSIEVGKMIDAIMRYTFDGEAMKRLDTDADAVGMSVRRSETDHWPVRYAFLVGAFQILTLNGSKRGFRLDGSLRRIATVFILIGYAIRVSQAGTAS